MGLLSLFDLRTVRLNDSLTTTKRTILMFNMNVAAQAELDEGQEFRRTLEKDQQYYFKIRAKKNKNGVRIYVRSRIYVC